MKKVIIVIGSLIFAVLMLPGILHPPADTVASGAATETEVKQLAHALDAALLQFRSDIGRFPEGGAGEIISALRGRNEKEKTYIDLVPAAVNDHGEMLDPWGTPFRITFDSASNTPRIQSAGPNLIFEDNPAKHSDDYYSWREKAASTLPFFQ